MDDHLHISPVLSRSIFRMIIVELMEVGVAGLTKSHDEWKMPDIVFGFLAETLNS